MMDINLLYFLKYGDVSLKILTEIGNTTRYVDFFFPNERILNTEFFPSRRYKRIQKVIKDNNILFHSSVLDSIYLLRHFSAPPKIVNLLFESGYKSIKSLVKLDSYEFNTIVNSKTNSSYNRISEAITEYTEWKKDNSDIITEIVILDYMQHNEEILFKNLLSHVRNYLIQNFIPFNEKEFYKVIKKMDEIKLIHLKSYEKLELKQLSLSDILSYEFENDYVFKSYIKGSTFKEIGEIEKVTRSRVQQVYVEVLEMIPELIEDTKYGEIFSIYKFSKSHFKKIFNESIEVYNYLNYKYDKGAENVIDYLKDYAYPDEFIDEFIKELGFFINYDNKVLQINKLNLLNNFMYENRNEIFTYEDARKKLNLVLMRYNIEPYSSDESRAFKSVVEYSQNTLASNNGTIRYFNCSSLDKDQIKLLEEVFDLPDGIYSGQKIYELNSGILYELNLQNGDELLDLYYKLNLNFTNVNKIVRRSEVQIGNKEKSEFVREILIEFNGESLNDLTWYLFDEYGLQKESMNGYILNEFRYFIVDRIITIDQPEAKINLITEYLNKKLQDEIYLLREMNNQTSEYFNELISINNLVLKATDYKVHNRYIIQKKYRGPLEAMKYWILKEDFFRMSDAQLVKDSYFYNARGSLLKDFEIFRLNEDLYITKDRLLADEINQEDIYGFIQSVEDYHLLTDDKYFTIKSILKSGFSHSLIKKGFENIFYEEILRNSSKLEAIHTTPRVFFEDNNDMRVLADVIYNLIETCESIDYQDLINKLLNTYGLSYDNSSLNYILVETPTYYSEATEKYYKNKEQYRMEVYGK